MARYRDSVCRLCRREGLKLFLKGERCYTEKCAIERRSYAPGDHGRDRRTKLTNYGVQLREKQKARRFYGIMERQFRNYFEKAAGSSGVTGETLLQLLETRLDNIAYRLSFAASRAAARQLVRHRHITVNGKIVDVPSFQVRPGDVVAVREKSRNMVPVLASLEGIGKRGELPDWLEVNEKMFSGRITRVPSRDGISAPVQENLIVELYSK
jgi:small subunit ribosomal protein S4